MQNFVRNHERFFYICSTKTLHSEYKLMEKENGGRVHNKYWSMQSRIYKHLSFFLFFFFFFFFFLAARVCATFWYQIENDCRFRPSLSTKSHKEHEKQETKTERQTYKNYVHYKKEEILYNHHLYKETKLGWKSFSF